MSNQLVGLGVDLGSTEVRIGAYNLETNELISIASKRVTYYDHGDRRFTQSSIEIIAAVIECVGKLPIDVLNVRSCGVAATCSLAVFYQDMTQGLKPYRLYGLDKDVHQNVVFWMDGSSTKQCAEINNSGGIELEYMGGSFIPEMGIPKLASVLKGLKDVDNPLSLEVFDLHTYIAYEMAERYHWDPSLLINKPNWNGIGHDGEVKGWNNDFYSRTLKPLGDFKIGPTRIKKIFSLVRVVSCIDCYSSWVAMCSAKSDESLFMAAGTSTCYIYANTKDQGCIPGVWGPFTNILDGGEKPKWSVYEAGQSTTGKLLEHLFDTHPAARTYSKDRGLLFADIEDAIEIIEAQCGQSVHLETKHMFTYGELQGNRTPFCDPHMSGMFIGENADTSFRDLVFKYVSVLEFLAFQTRHIKDCFKANVSDIRISGSQARNTRLLSLISLVNDLPVKIPAHRADLMGVKGAYLMGKAKHLDVNVVDIIAENNSKSPTAYEINILGSLKNNQHLKKLLQIKYDIYLDMAETQRKYRSMVDSCFA
ncbi:LANO_0G02850g1_1 [Lachancea nothofagi CBS 11611]|uniref:LANO_0G02850g1_1 n=1 Tax=Lachancea nothofagi CBS 11611 TaxID=1266666 RepID=A0A1G4KFD9_9SACH|nr:LANO_0G02850g1_1 [Lachancea nothofagi CBS 11611]